MASRGRPATGQKNRYAGKHVQFVDNSEKVIQALQKQAYAALGAAGKVYVEALKESAPKHTGALSNAAGFRLRSASGKPKLIIGFYSHKEANKKGIRNYFANPAWIEFGIKPHVIKAGRHRGNTGKRALANARSGILYGRTVNNPGRAARPFIKNTVMANMSAALAAMEPKIAELNKSIEDLQNNPMPDIDKGGE